MDLEAIQLLNLSPIPELSEIELSTMLDQLSGLSDINGDLTDRNVEDIIKEAEDLLDKSISSKTNETRSLEKSPDVVSDTISKDISPVIEHSEQQSNKTKHSSNTVCDYDISHNNSHEDDRNKHFNSPVSPQSKVYSPGGSINHIKSTIDSLKELSTLVEKKFNSQTPISPKDVKNTENENNDYEETMTSENQSIISSNQVTINPKVKIQEEITKETKSLNKSIKLLNCFERLYQVKPARLTANKKPKVIDKTINKKKSLKDSKNCKRNGKQEKMEKTFQSSAIPGEEDFSRQDTARLRYFQSKNSPEFVPEDKTVDDHLTNVYLGGQVQSFDEKLIMKVLEKMEEIKDHPRKVDVVTNIQDEKGADRLNLEVEPNEPGQIQRLEQQFSVLKEKYEFQMEKLETENQRLREALAQQQCFVIDSEIPKVDVQQQTENSEERRMSFGNCRTPKNSPSSSQENLQKDVKEAFSQTEEVKYTQEVETKKTDDKENIGGKKKPGRCKPFADVNTRHKKAFEYETQLLATVRGLQAEVTTKDKENKKLKNEIESARKQIKKLTGTRVENLKKYNTGTQTIGLGPVAQKPYNPEEYEALGDFEKENEDLRTRMKALEEDFESLKEKRISDLQALHQVHEEEMGKLVSKLETQSALTRHLHSLLMNR